MITAFYAGLCGVLLLGLYVRVSQRRLETKIGIGTGGDAVLEQRIRAHANFIECAPLALIFLYLFEQSATSPLYVHTFGATFILARLAHAQGISSNPGRSAGRFYGSLVTLLVMAGLTVALLIDGLRSL